MSVSTRLYKQSSRLPKYTPLPWHVYLRQILAKDAVMWIALALAAVSSLAVRPPLAAYAEYIDVKTLACLASLMVASGGFMISGVFDRAASRLAGVCGSSRSLMAAMVFGTFAASMFITNDVALIVFVPMTLLAFKRVAIDPATTVVLQTVAANVGSILLPMGNPQNLFLYSYYQMSMPEFLRTMLPLSLVGAAVLALFCLFSRKACIRCIPSDAPPLRPRDAMLYSCLFLVAALAVFDLLDYRAALAVAAATALLKGRSLLQQVDYALLATFVGFFVFVGNTAAIPQAQHLLTAFAEKGVFVAAVLSSQVISNVPAAVLLSRFTQDHQALLAGVSVGGCGTLIASMASLISYKLHIRSGGERKKYLLVFTTINVLFLLILGLTFIFING